MASGGRSCWSVASPGWAPLPGRPASCGRREARRRRWRSASWTIDFYNGQQAAYGTDSGFRELGYLILAVTEDDERSGRERLTMQQATGLDAVWLDADQAAETAITLSPNGHRGGSYIGTDGAIDPPRNVRAYSLAMQAAGVELRERTAFTGLRTEPTAGGGQRVTGVHTPTGHDRHRARPAHGRSEPPCRRQAGRCPHPRGGGAPHGLRPGAASRLRPAADADGVRHRGGPVLAPRGGRTAVRLQRPRRDAGRGAPDRLGVPRADAGAAGGRWCR